VPSFGVGPLRAYPESARYCRRTTHALPHSPSFTLCRCRKRIRSNQDLDAGCTCSSRHEWPVKDNLYVAHNFRFGSGETLPELKLRYLTLGSAHRNAAGRIDNAVLLLHGTGGNRRTLLVPQFSDVLFGPGQPLDITRYFLIFPDDTGQGDSSQPYGQLYNCEPPHPHKSSAIPSLCEQQIQALPSFLSTLC
jgi:hypothetical protein